MKKLLVCATLAVLLGAASSCKGKGSAGQAAPAETAPAASAPEAGEKTLYERLGKEEAIRAVVNQFIANVVADARINKFFADADMEPLKNHLVELIAQSAGGPQKYTGRDMKTVHAGMGITGADFDALVEDLVKALDQFKVADREKSDLLAILGPMKSDIVEK
ncbi:MAG: group 1 truncated hemoglobin [Candidatus Eisenbacteria bacterium]|uniref:Group 1 truncated hemoglobin n=1 Tax=Eiseniibacteriota bacterium TaxID=2212470 RepID=A0A538TYB2_UNCEI|nr:MAG: group 1 truncated hemoglobin [Candidatus Eisenbacteria bacterium]